MAKQHALIDVSPWGGVEMPLWTYTLTYSCGCIYSCHMFTVTPPQDMVFAWDCPWHYTGPFGNVWD